MLDGHSTNTSEMQHNGMEGIKFKYMYIASLFFMFEFPCIISLYYIKNQQDATLAVLFISTVQ